MEDERLRVLLCERNFAGHRKIYFSYLRKIENVDIYSYCPESIDNDLNFFKFNEKNSLIGYLKWILKIKQIVKQNNIDVVHFLDGDSIMKYFGFPLSIIKSKKIIITYHHFFSGRLRKLSYKMMLKNKNRVAVVHTEKIKKSLEEIIKKEVQLCYYPSFDFEKVEKIDIMEAKKRWHCPSDVPTIGIIGGMCRYKNIIPFLNVLKQIDYENTKYHVLICGKCSDISEEEILEEIKPYKEHVSISLKKLDDYEYQTAIVASDIIFSIYGKEFDGASGPMLDGIVANKLILGCSHGSTGEIIKKYNLGFVSDIDNIENMKRNIKNSLSISLNFKYDELANGFKNKLLPLDFQKRYNRIYSNKK